MRARRHTLSVGCLALILTASGAACHRHDPESGMVIASDSLEGTVRVVGVEGAQRTVLATDDGRSSIELAGSPLLSRVTGLRVAVIGTRTARRMDVSRFRVIAANGVPATDGTLTADGGLFVLVLPSGVRLPVAHPSPGVRALVGHRVWISGDLGGETVAYGAID